MNTREITDRKGRHFLWSEFDGLGFFSGFVKRFAPQGLDAKYEEVRNLEMRDDDLMICTYPKTGRGPKDTDCYCGVDDNKGFGLIGVKVQGEKNHGTHWICEIVYMVTKGTAEYDKRKKVDYMIDVQSSDCINALPSPRLLNSHYPITWLPKQMEDKRTKIIHMIRNPKDIAVSFFYQIKTLNYEFEDEPPFVTFSEFLPYITGEYGVYFYGSLFRYFKEMKTFSQENPDRVLNIYYEDMKKRPVHEIQKLAQFLNKDLSESIIKDIVEKCSFNNLKRYEETMKEDTQVFESRLSEEQLERRRKHAPATMYRKGEVGDWKNHFTVEESKQFDTLLEERFQDSHVDFIYSI